MTGVVSSPATSDVPVAAAGAPSRSGFWSPLTEIPATFETELALETAVQDSGRIHRFTNPATRCSVVS